MRKMNGRKSRREKRVQTKSLDVLKLLGCVKRIEILKNK